MSWGPQQKQPSWDPGTKVMAVFSVVMFTASIKTVLNIPWWAAALILAVIVAAGLMALGYWHQRKHPSINETIDAEDPLGSVRGSAARAGGGAYVGVREERLVFSAPQRAVLLLGPPRSGKTSSVIIPSILCHHGPVLCTSTKPDVMHATAPVRSRDGKLWIFDPTGTTSVADEHQLRWSPLACSTEWDQAQLIARAMASTVGAGVSDGTHWARRAQALLAPMLHAGARAGLDMEHVVSWVMAHDVAEPAALLEENNASRLATGSLQGILNTAERERSSIFSAAADALDAYTTRAGILTTKRLNFNAGQFIASHDTIYISAPAEHQAAVAPIVCGLLAEIRRQTYLAHRDRRLPNPVFYALDEVANIAPVEELPSIASEGGGQGLKLLAAIQDLSQARHRWSKQADGFLTLLGTKIILSGIADRDTLETISVALGEYDRQTVSRTGPTRPSLAAMMSGVPQPRATQTVSTQRQRVLSPGEIANIPAGHLLHLEGVQWQLVNATPAHRDMPWQTLIAPAPASP